MSTAYYHFYINGSFSYSEIIDSRLSLNDFRQHMEIPNTTLFIHSNSTISIEDEDDIHLYEIIQNNWDIHLRDCSIQPIVTGNNTYNTNSQKRLSFNESSSDDDSEYTEIKKNSNNLVGKVSTRSDNNSTSNKYIIKVST
jgi:hypothetical protein